MITAHIDRQTATIDGVTFTNTHSGQKRAYGDSFYEYDITSDLPAEEVEKVCRERVYKSSVNKADCWRTIARRVAAWRRPFAPTTNSSLSVTANTDTSSPPFTPTDPSIYRPPNTRGRYAE